MSIESFIVASHLNKVQLGQHVRLGLPEDLEQMPANFAAKKIAINFICLGLGFASLDILTKRQPNQ